MTAAQQSAKQYRMEEWSRIISERVHNGQSVREWCLENGVSQRVYYYRLRQVREYAAACVEFSKSQSADQTSLIVPGFAEVRLAPLPAPPALPGTSQTSQIYIEIGEVRINADSTYPPDKLAALLRELTRPC